MSVQILILAFVSLLLFVNLASTRSSYLNGKHFRVGYYEAPFGSFTEVNELNETVVRGVFADMLQWMSIRHNFTYVLVPSVYTDNLLAEFNTKQLDWIMANFVTRHGRTQIGHLLFPFSPITYSVIIPYPKPEVNMFSVVLPYTASVWVCFLASMCAIGCLLKWVASAKQYIHQHQEPDSFLTYEGAILYVIGVATNQGAACFSKARTVRLLAAVWCLAAFVMVNAYSSSLTTYMMAPSFKPLIDSIRDIDNKSYPQILAAGTGSFQRLIQDTPAYQPLRDNAFKLPSNYCGVDFVDEKLNEQCLTLVKKGGHVFVTDTWAAVLHLDNDHGRTGTCGLTLAHETISFGHGGWLMSLNSTQQLKNAIDVLIMETMSYALEPHWNNFYNKPRKFCNKYRSLDHNLRKLTVKDFTSAFILLGGGIAISLSIFVYEAMKGRLLPRATKKTQKPANGIQVSLHSSQK